MATRQASGFKPPAFVTILIPFFRHSFMSGFHTLKTKSGTKPPEVWFFCFARARSPIVTVAKVSGSIPLQNEESFRRRYLQQDNQRQDIGFGHDEQVEQHQNWNRPKRRCYNQCEDLSPFDLIKNGKTKRKRILSTKFKVAKKSFFILGFFFFFFCRIGETLFTSHFIGDAKAICRTPDHQVL